jgi:aspartyl-tRNA(Asn)/glutamyl-tRNA(Gln) amidotransferase subunit A
MAEAMGTLSELRARLDAGETSSVELVDAALERAEGIGRRLNAFVGLRAERAREEAVQADALRAAGKPRSALDGIPIAIKDNMVQHDEPTTCASRILEGFVSPYSGTAVERVVAAGAIVIGRTNMDEFAMGSSTEHSCAGPTRNPWDTERTPGGSSGGSATAVAAGNVPAARGSDTGGAIRQPPALCGVVGMKPTYGRVSRWGLVAFASSLDQIGAFGRTADDCARVLEVIAGHDPRDSTSIPEPAPQLSGAALDGDVSGLTIGIPREYFAAEGADARVLEAVHAAAAELEAAGARLVEVGLPHTSYAIATYYLVATAEASSNLARYDGVRYGRRAAGVKGLTEMYCRSRSEGFGTEVKRRIMLGTYVLSAGYYDAYYRKAQQVRTLLRGDFEAAFERCDALLTPTTPEVAFKVGERADPLSMYLSDIYTVSANLAGIPGLSIPCGRVDGLPVGMQLLGRALDEQTPLRIADAYQRLTDHHTRRPPEEPS